MKTFFRYLLALFFVLAGINHFLKPDFYVALMPPFLPAPLFLVYLSGAVEILCGIGVAIPRISRYAAWGVFATLIAIFPANIYHAVSGGLVHPDLPPFMANPVAAWMRLPFQFVFLAWAYWMTRPDREPAETTRTASTV
jgi:uncharacterized membrane protein